MRWLGGHISDGHESWKRGCEMLQESLRFGGGLRSHLLYVVVVTVVGALCGDAPAATLPESLQPGDIIFTTNNANSYTQIRGGVRLGAGPTAYGTGTGNERLG